MLTAVLATGCSPAATTVTNTTTATSTSITIDKPGLTSEEAIAIAHRHCVKSPVNIQEEAVGKLVKVDRDNLKYWNAAYTGNGIWDVSVKTSESSCHWTVSENTFSTEYIGTD